MENVVNFTNFKKGRYNFNNFVRFSSPSCPGDFTGWASSRSEAEDLFYNQADFGFVKEQIKELKNYCKDSSASNSSSTSTFSGSSSSASHTSTSSLLCSKNLMFCTANHLLLDLRHVKVLFYFESL